MFQPLPAEYIEVAQGLCGFGRACFGENFYQARSSYVVCLPAVQQAFRMYALISLSQSSFTNPNAAFVCESRSLNYYILELQVKDRVESIRKVRFTKIEAGLRILEVRL